MAGQSFVPPYGTLLQYSVAVFYFGDPEAAGQFRRGQHSAQEKAQFRHWRRTARLAAQWLEGTRRRKVSGALGPILSRCRPGTPSYACVAYALAWRGIDVPRNAQRVALGQEAVRRSATSNRVDWLVLSYDGWPWAHPGLRTPYRLEEVYRRHHSPRVLDSLLGLGCDGAGCVAWGDAVGDLLAAYPAQVLRRARLSRGDMAGLRRAVLDPDTGAPRDRVRRPLAALARSRDRSLAATARELLAAAHRAGRE
ncbi:MAG TPA: hypothetical protein VGN26_20735 [Armatimonadota bacterium]